MTYPVDQLRRILFVDIETATQYESYGALEESMASHWRKKMRRFVQAEDYPAFEEEFSALYNDKGAIYAEFAKVVCISVGYLHLSEEGTAFKVTSFYEDNEVDLLKSFHSLLNSHYYDRFNQFLCGHNIKEFDVPFICRRSLVHNLALPNLLNIAGYKPWQVHHLLDTMEMWKYGDYKHYTSLDLLCGVLGVATSKDGMNGSQVSDAYWAGRLEEIVNYCQRDVVATAQVYMRCVSLKPFEVENVIIIKPAKSREEE